MPPPKVKAKFHNPLPDNARFKVTFAGKQITLRVDMIFISNPRFVVMEILEVKQK